MTSWNFSRTLALALPLTFLACSDDNPGDSETSSSETGDGDGDASGDGDGDGDGDPAGDGDGDAPGDGDGDAPGDGDGDAPGDGDGDPQSCDPEGEAVATFHLDAIANDGEFEWDVVCMSGGVTPADGESGWQLALTDCVSQNEEQPPSELNLVVDSTPATEPFVEADVEVRLHWVERPPFIPGRWFTLRDGSNQTLLLAGFDATAVLPANQAPEFDYAPLEIAQVSIGCTPFEHDSQCGIAERQAFTVGWDGDEITVSDRNTDIIGQLVSYELVVGQALEFTEPACDDFPNRILQALFFMIPEG